MESELSFAKDFPILGEQIQINVKIYKLRVSTENDKELNVSAYSNFVDFWYHFTKKKEINVENQIIKGFEKVMNERINYFNCSNFKEYLNLIKNRNNVENSLSSRRNQGAVIQRWRSIFGSWMSKNKKTKPTLLPKEYAADFVQITFPEGCEEQPMLGFLS